MADIIQGFGPQNIQIRFKDMEDGSWAMVVYGGTGGGGGGDASAANQLTEIARLEAVRDRLPSNAIFTPGTPKAASTPVGMTATTSATGTAWVAFGSQACSSLDLINTSVLSASPSAIAAAVNLRWRYVGQTPWFTLREGASQLVVGITNANQIEIQRADGSNTQVPLSAIAYP